MLSVSQAGVVDLTVGLGAEGAGGGAPPERMLESSSRAGVYDVPLGGK